jgi:GSH-dependent disulfide-bond oxidoreductase
MIDLHYWPTPNGWKISIMLEECGLPYRMIPVNIARGAQFEPDFLAISPNNRMPAIVDHAPPGGGEAVSVFESGAILVYLAEKTGRFLPPGLRERKTVFEWLMWQMGGLGPMLGQSGHFSIYAREKIPYAIERYDRESRRLYRVLDTQLGRTGAFVAGAYSIADMACFPWIRTHTAQNISLDEHPHVRRWYEALKSRPAVRRGIELGRSLRIPEYDEEGRRHLFGDRVQPR